MNANVSGCLKKGFVGLAPLCVALMGVFFVPTVWGETVEYGENNTISNTFYSDATVIGLNNSITGAAHAYGFNNKASGDYSGTSVAVGVKNNTAAYGYAFGQENSVAGVGFAFGENNEIIDTGRGGSLYPSFAVGRYNKVQGNQGNFVFGSSNKNSEYARSTIAVGIANFTGSSGTSAFGQGNYVAADNAIAVGSSNFSTGVGAVVFGRLNNYDYYASDVHNSVVVGENSLVMGMSNNWFINGANNYRKAYADYGEVMGEDKDVLKTGESSSVIGIGNVATGDESLTVGKDNINAGKVAVALGNDNTVLREGDVAVGVRNKVSSGIAVGYANESGGATVFGYSNTANKNSTVLGGKNKAKVENSLVVGDWNELKASVTDPEESANNSIAVGYSNSLYGSNAIVIGRNSKANKDGIAFGLNTYVSGKGSIAIGSNASVSYSPEGAIALGYDSSTKRAGGDVGYSTAGINHSDDKSGAWISTYGAMSVGNSSKTRQITGVAAGKYDTDAVNVAQLKELASQIGNGNSGNNNNNTTTAPSLTVAAGNDNIQVKTANNTATVSLNNKISVDSVTVGTVSINNDGKISGVAAGAAEKDAVNFGQLKALSDTVSNLQDTVDNLTPTNPNNNNPQPVATAITVTGNSGSGKVTNKAQIVGDGSNVKTTVSGSQVSIALGDDIAVKTVTADKLSAGQTTLSATGLNNGGNVISNVKAGSADLEAVNVKQLKDANAANLKASVQAVKGDNKNITTQAGDKEVQVALNNDISLNSVTAADKITVGSLTVNKNGKITGVVSDINDDSTAVNVGLLKEELKKGGNYRPITVAGDTGSFEVDNGGRANWVGDGQNITTAANGDTVKIELNKNIEVDSVTAGSTVVNNNGVKVGNNGVALTANGLNNGGQVISNVAAGSRPTDAVNVSQLNNAVGSVHGRINGMEKDSNAGIAQAMATGAMMTSTQPGQGFLSLSGSTYRGEQGYAMGYSHMSDSGKWGVKFIGSGNSRGKFGGAASVGFRLY